jgi:hypothetical protein
MDTGGQRSEQDELEQADSEQLAFLRKLRAHALTSLSRVRRHSASPSSSAFDAVEDDDGDSSRLRLN